MIRRSKRIEKKRNWAMLTITTDDLGGILRDYGVTSPCRGFTELQRYDYEDYDPTGKSVRLIIKAETEDGRAFVVRLKNEEDVTPEIVEAQSGFAAAPGVFDPKREKRLPKNPRHSCSHTQES